jgi:hypothetical protein
MRTISLGVISLLLGFIFPDSFVHPALLGLVSWMLFTNIYRVLITCVGSLKFNLMAASSHVVHEYLSDDGDLASFIQAQA